jgi:hypothetical protein
MIHFTKKLGGKEKYEKKNCFGQCHCDIADAGEYADAIF